MDTGAKAPTVTGSVYNEWSNPSHAFASDNSYAAPGRSSGSNEQDYSSFDFGLSSLDTIDGIEVVIEGKGGSARTMAIDVKLSYDAGSHLTAAKSNSWVNVASDSTRTYGGPTDTWGRTWAPSELSDANFLVYCLQTALGTSNQVDQITVKVYYTPGGTQSNDTRDAEMHGIATITVSRDAEVRGSLDDNDERDAEVFGSITSTATRDAEVHGQDSANSSRDAETTGSIAVTTIRDAEVSGTASSNSSRDAQMTGATVSDDARDAETHGIDTVSASRDAEVHGEESANAARDTEVEGAFFSNSARGAEVEGANAPVVSVSQVDDKLVLEWTYTL